MAKVDLKAVTAPGTGSTAPISERSHVHASDPSEADPAAALARERIAEANRTLQARTEKLLAFPISVLTEQRDRALADAARIQVEAGGRHEAFVQEQDAFIALLMVEHEQKLAEVKKQLRTTYERLQRLGALSEAVPGVFGKPSSPPPPSSPDDLRQRLDDAETRLILQNEQLRDACRDLDEARAEADQLAEERDDALRSIDDLRAEVHEYVDALREELGEARQRLEEAHQELEDTRDEAHEELHRLNERLDRALRELDERREEVRRLRERLGAPADAGRNSRVPPPPSSEDLESTRDENIGLRKQLIDAKRTISRVSRELEIVRRPTPIGRVGLSPAIHSVPPVRKSTWPGGVEAQEEPKRQAALTRLPRSETPAGGIGTTRRRPWSKDE